MQDGAERSESVRNLVTYDYVKMNLYMWRQVMTHPCGTECVLCTTHAQYRILCKKVKIFYRLNQGSNLKSSDVVSDVLPLHH